MDLVDGDPYKYPAPAGCDASPIKPRQILPSGLPLMNRATTPGWTEAKSNRFPTLEYPEFPAGYGYSMETPEDDTRLEKQMKNRALELTELTHL